MLHNNPMLHNLMMGNQASTQASPISNQPTSQSPESIGAPSLTQIDEQIAQHQAVIDQLLEIRSMILGGAIQRRVEPGVTPGATPIQPNPSSRGY